MLTDPIIAVRMAAGDSRLTTFPEALAWLCEENLAAFEGLSAHQRHGWELFLFQAAALALTRAGQAEAANDDSAWRALADPEAWAQRLRALAAPYGEEAWALVVNDLSRPAFLQSPIPNGTLDGYRLLGRTPDEIDVLVTAKGHDVKPARAGAAEAQHWLYALTTLQTMQGYSGPKNYGIARMNGGFGSRPLLMVSPSSDLPARFRRGVQAALAARASALEQAGGYYCEDGLALLWLKDWAREDQLSLADLDPLFIEVCRRVRLVRNERGRIEAWGRPSEMARVHAPKEAAGNFGDAWTPILAGAALKVGPGGFDYRLLSRLIGGEFDRPEAMEPPPGHRGNVWLQASVLVRGQGKTYGLHERWLPVPGQIARRMGRSDPEIGRLAKAMIDDAGQARKSLRTALLSFLQGGVDRPDGKDERPREWLERFEAEVDGVFFDHLFRQLEPSGEAAARQAWLGALTGIARRLFHQAMERLSPPEARREKAGAVAALIFGAMLNKLVPKTEQAT